MTQIFAGFELYPSKSGHKAPTYFAPDGKPYSYEFDRETKNLAAKEQAKRSFVRERGEGDTMQHRYYVKFVEECEIYTGKPDRHWFVFDTARVCTYNFQDTIVDAFDTQQEAIAFCDACNLIETRKHAK